MAASATETLTQGIKTQAARLGFDDVGIAPAVHAPDHPRFLQWLAAGHAAEMAYLSRHAQARAHPGSILEGARSVVMTATIYGHTSQATEESPRTGKVARYARGQDYHRVLWNRLEQLLDWIKTQRDSVRGRAVVDTAPLLERDFARQAGLGWIGKNTMLIGRRTGSFTFLGALLLDLELDYDAPFQPNHCGTCTRCLDACPTDAFVAPYQLDARRCISYWTIEKRTPLTPYESENLHGWVFGCDICQEVCPWNRKAPPGREPAFQPRPELASPDLIDWLEAEPESLQSTIRGTALQRARRTGLLRNAALLLGSRRVQEARPALERLRASDDPTLQRAAQWALHQLNKPEPARESSIPDDPPI